MTYDITDIIMLAIEMIILTLVVFILPRFSSRLKNDNILTWVSIAVNAAEQLCRSGVVQDKKKYVKDFLADNGITYDDAKIELMIEAEVNRMKKYIYETKMHV